ncbi:recombination factor protein RarA, partial [Acinetobacter baumannii]
FLDEIHRFNKSQQDALLPHVESGLLTLIGATTENPSFEVNPALRSRARVYVLKPLDEDAVRRVLERALGHPEGLEGV